MTHPIQLPSARHAQVWIDFDGTITKQDVLDKLIERYALDDSWKHVEARWQRGEIGSRQCLTEEFALIRIGQSELRNFLDTIAIDRGLLALLKVLGENRVPAAILSDGIDSFIQHILRREGITHLPARSNAIRHEANRLEMHCPHADKNCESAAAHCKCASATALRLPERKTIYIGDGRSDLCPARKADVVFAKGALASALAAEAKAFCPFETLDEIAAILANAWTPQAVLA